MPKRKPDLPADDIITTEQLLHFTKSVEDGCMLWTSGLSVNGRPIYRDQERLFSVVVAIYEDVHGPRENKHWVVEPRCGNIRCIAPEHLVYGPRGKNIKPLMGAPLMPGQTIKSAGYVRVHRKRGPSIWEPLDIAKAVWAAQWKHICYVCGTYIKRTGQVHCSKKCLTIRSSARTRRLLGRPAPGDERYRVGVGDAKTVIG